MQTPISNILATSGHRITAVTPIVIIDIRNRKIHRETAVKTVVFLYCVGPE